MQGVSDLGMSKENQERKRFLMCFGYLFFDTSDTMRIKCWRRIAVLPASVRNDLINDLARAARGKIDHEDVEVN